MKQRIHEPLGETLQDPGAILLVSCYELGHQPLGLASPLGFLERAGFTPEALDIGVERFDREKTARARFVGISVPMHTALRLGVRVAEEVRRTNPGCHICFYGLYASRNADYLLGHVADSVIGDPDVLNGPGYSLAIVRAMYQEFPEITFDFTAKVEHILERRAIFPELGALGCVFMVSAVESLSDAVLANLEKGHTRADVYEALRIVRDAAIAFRPTWVAFTPWTTLDDYLEILDFVETEGLIDHVDPVQCSIRLLVPPGSALLKSQAMRPHLGPLVPEAFYYKWTHPDPRMDELHRAVSTAVEQAARDAEDPGATFYRVRERAETAAGRPPRTAGPVLRPERARPPRLTEAWFC